MSGKAWIWRSPSYVETALQDPPEPAPGCAIVRVLQVGVCGSDLLNIQEGPPDGQCFGHEWFGRVARAPRVAAEGVEEGAWVTGSPFIGCGACSACKAGFSNHCGEVRILGTGAMGAMRSWLELPTDQLIAVRPDLESVGILLEPASVAVEGERLLRLCGPIEGPVAIVGAGPIGILTACRLRFKGQACILFETDAARRQLAQSLGFTTFDSNNQEAMEPHRKAFSALIDCSSALDQPGGWGTVFELAQRAARVVCVAKYPKSFRIEIDRLARGGHTVIWMRGAPHDALRAAVEWGAHLKGLRNSLGYEFLPALKINLGIERAMLRRSLGKVVLEMS